MDLRGVILAGGKGTRLGELTKVTNKHLLPVGPYPMVYHPLKKMTGCGIKDILLVSGTEHMGDFVELLGSGKDHNCRLTYRVQDEAGGIAQALGLAEGFSRDARSLVILGDNIFQDNLVDFAQEAAKHPDSAFVALKKVHDPGGILLFDVFLGGFGAVAVADGLQDDGVMHEAVDRGRSSGRG